MAVMSNFSVLPGSPLLNLFKLAENEKPESRSEREQRGRLALPPGKSSANEALQGSFYKNESKPQLGVSAEVGGYKIPCWGGGCRRV